MCKDAEKYDLRATVIDSETFINIDDLLRFIKGMSGQYRHNLPDKMTEREEDIAEITVIAIESSSNLLCSRIVKSVCEFEENREPGDTEFEVDSQW